MDQSQKSNRLLFEIHLKCAMQEFFRSGPLTAEELIVSETGLFKVAQADGFNNELINLKHNKKIVKTSPLHRFDVFLEKGIIRIGGRLKDSNLDEHLKFPIVLPKQGQITQMVLQWCHENIFHAGRGFTLNEVRQRGLWIK